LQGAAQVAYKRQDVMTHRAARLEVLLAEVRGELSQLAEHSASLATRINALDTTIDLMHPGVPPDAAGCVRAWAGRYGKRGALTAFVQDYLQAVRPRAVYGSEIKREVIARFELHLITSQERALMGNKVRNALVRLRDLHGTAQSTESWRGAQSRMLWSWKQDSPLDALRQAAIAAETADERPADANAL